MQYNPESYNVVEEPESTSVSSGYIKVKILYIVVFTIF
jgi:hypothetical protein